MKHNYTSANVNKWGIVPQGENIEYEEKSPSKVIAVLALIALPIVIIIVVNLPKILGG